MKNTLIIVRKNGFLALFSEEEHLGDQLFFFSFYLCIGLLPPLIGILGHKAVSLPLIVITVLIILRFFIRKSCRQRMVGYFPTSSILLLLVFALVLLAHALIGVFEDLDRLRILFKPVIILMITVFLTFVWSHFDVLKRDLLFKLALIGFGIGLAVTVLKIVFINSLGNQARQEVSSITNFLQEHDMINKELVILSILVFVINFGIKDQGKRFVSIAGLSIAVFVTSFFVTGLLLYRGRGIIFPVYSETLQFGVPLALLAFVVAYKFPRLVTNFLFGGIAFVLVTAPWLFQLFLHFVQSVSLPRARKFLVRSEIWDAVGAKALEAPFFGHGIDSARYLKFISIDNIFYKNNAIHHPHNMILQIWLDLGLVGIALVGGLLYLAWQFVVQTELSKRPQILAGLTMLVVFMMVTHSVWQTWSLALISYFCVYISIAARTTPKA